MLLTKKIRLLRRKRINSRCNNFKRILLHKPEIRVHLKKSIIYKVFITTSKLDVSYVCKRSCRWTVDRAYDDFSSRSFTCSSYIKYISIPKSPTHRYVSDIEGRRVGTKGWEMDVLRKPDSRCMRQTRETCTLDPPEHGTNYHPMVSVTSTILMYTGPRISRGTDTSRQYHLTLLPTTSTRRNVTPKRPPGHFTR